MNKGISVIKNFFKVVVWLAAGFTLLFFIVVLLIQIPSVQTRLVKFATSFISTKTHTKVEIQRIGISFPKTIVIDGLYLEDLAKDTFLYAAKAKVDMEIYGLFSKKIAVNMLSLNAATVKIYSTKSNPEFNYNFLVDAFSDTTSVVSADTVTTPGWIISIDEVELQNFRLIYHDEYAGMNVLALLRNSAFTMDQMDFKESVYNIDDLLIDDSYVSVQVKKSENPPLPPSGNKKPTLTANKLQINRSLINYTDSVNHQSVIAAIENGKLNDVSILMDNMRITSTLLSLAKSKIQYHSFEPELPPTTIVSVSDPNDQAGWKISVKKLVMDDIYFSAKMGNKPEMKNVFDSGYLQYNNVMVDAADFYYSPVLTAIKVKKFSATDQNKFAITRFEGDLRMEPRSISAINFKVNTLNSAIDADLKIQFSSLTTFINSLEFINLDLVLRNLRFRNSDLLYFNPDLIAQPFFKNRSNITTASGRVNGALKNLKAKNLSVKTGTNTILKTDFHIKGLPEYETAYYDFPNLRLISGKKDMVTFAGPFLPENIEIPENFNLDMAFKGKIKEFATTANVTSSFGAANLIATIDQAENFSGKVILNNLNVGKLLKDTIMYGPVSLTAEAIGKGLDMNTIKAKIKADATELYLNKYNFHNLSLDGTVNGKQFEGKAKLDDENADINFDGLVNINPGKEQYKFKLNVLGADLYKLKLTEADVQISFISEADLKGGSVDKMNGTAGINKIIIARGGKKYLLDSFLTASVNEPNKSEINISSALIDIKYAGTISPIALPALLNRFINRYFQVSDTLQQVKKTDQSNFNFEIQFHNHPILSKVLLPQLLEFDPGVIKGSFDSEKNDLKLTAIMKKIVYGSTEIKDFAVDINSDDAALNYKFTSAAIYNSQISLDNFSFDGKLADNILFANVSSTDGQKKKLLIKSQVTKNDDTYRLTLDPKEFYLVNNQWNIAADNSIEFGDQGFRINKFFIDHAESHINVASVHNLFNDDILVEIKNFKLDDISGIIEKDTALVKGTVEGNLLFKRVAESYGLISDVKLNDLIVREVPIGNVSLKAMRSETRKFDIDLNLSGPDNNLTANGYFEPNGVANVMNIKTIIQSLSMKTVEAFSMGQITEAEGTLTGNFLIEGTTAAPELSGELTFNNAFLTPSLLNNRFEIKNETIQLKKDGIYFDTFTLLDGNNNTAVIDGSVQMNQFSDFVFALQVNTKDFMLFNTSAKDNNEFFGRMVVDSKINVTGPMSLPVVNARVTMKKGSNFTFSVPEDKLSTDMGEGVVEFVNKMKFHRILTRNDRKGEQTTGTTGYDISSIISIDKEATLRLLMDPASTDSLVVRGEAALSFTMDQSGKMSLTGAYNLSDGSYLVSLESIIKKKFAINAGSTIIWNGDPLDANISIDAIYTVRASPYDLVADQISGLSDVDKGGYKQRYPFQVMLKLRGEILRPEISFEIQLSPEDRGILGGAVNQKLNMLNEDESALNKQVFALLVLGRFTQENPFQTESAGGASTIIRSTVGKFLSSQLNQLSSKALPGMELNFDIQSFNDYQSGQAQGRTQVEIGVKKQLFNERLSIQLGGTVDVEGDRSRQNSASDITGDVTVEYKLTKDGSFRLKGFRHNQYEGAIEGQLIETGVGVMYVRDFNSWRRLFKPYNRKVQPPKLPEEIILKDAEKE